MKGSAAFSYLNAAYFAKLFQETPSLGYYTAVSLAQSQSLKLLIYFFELGATRGFTSRLISSSWISAWQLLPNFLSNLEFVRLYASDTLIEGYLHKAFSLKTPAVSPILGDGWKIGVSCIVLGGAATIATWRDYILHLRAAGRALIFLLSAVIYRSVRFVWIYLIKLLLQAIFLVILTTGAVTGVVLQIGG